ncbi:hypothetical protein V6N11_080517 [Hibiscus sabdariffa]|uniref:Uncharacterized protein n=1 Tax=Hibiscus sabdariffa TaxID=183260 RepID=A0ABR2AFJ8_9ROSI
MKLQLDRRHKELQDMSGESFALLYGRERLSVPVIGIDLLRLVPDGFQLIGMSILKLFHLVLGIIKTVKRKQLLQGACLKQMATSQLT